MDARLSVLRSADRGMSLQLAALWIGVTISGHLSDFSSQPQLGSIRIKAIGGPCGGAAQA